ncbi:mechanosensitive ion channel family protein [Idiomarina sp. HP20-50]|uniref:mechanosensitive ion channel family protein n=1 Tax=Idiomarina sp. HP20-50 TaxID=3070813 RepID=UPI00294B59C0|nr:mechanosensitive ion channel domain-containing protein [Idiomarina sp. HP20-50]MDV6316177.1 mechanosensitive ion channel [Idiomarina sp. HP20-50]
MQMSWTDVSSGLSKIWNTELWKTGDAQIYLSQIIIAIAVIIVGVIAIRWLGSSLVKRAIKSGHASQNTIYAFRKLFSFLAYVLIVLVALPVAGIPITMFAVLGGALAIGVGFGAQNLLNNLISGMILIAERPIRIGDIVELENERGRIEEIGNRCVRIKRFDGVHVLVPNSYFLEQRVVNWTLVSTEIRSTVSVGVAYGSPIDRVRELMLEAASKHEKIVQALPFEVFFDDFGDNSLNFNLLFWTEVEAPMDIRRVQSDIRFTINRLFAENDITIAFPQRDVHLDTLKPLEIKMT